MASRSSLLLPLSLLLLVLLISPNPALSKSCTSHKFKTPNKSFATCTDLPHLSAFLHHTYNPSDSTLSIAFTAPLKDPAGWVAWAINPTAVAMVGSQALFAYIAGNGSVVVNTLSIQSYTIISVGPISINVSGLAGESSSSTINVAGLAGDSSSSSTITIFGKWHLHPKIKSINQVWQVGAALASGVPLKHDVNQENLRSKSILHLLAPNNATPADAPTAASDTAAAASGPGSGKNAAAQGLLGLSAFGAGCAGVVVAAFDLLF